MLAGAALSQAGRALVHRQHVGIAVYAHRIDVGWIERIVPGASRELSHPRPHSLAQDRTGKATAAIVKYSDNIPLGDASRRRIGGVQADRLSTLDFGCLARGADVELAVQP